MAQRSCGGEGVSRPELQRLLSGWPGAVRGGLAGHAPGMAKFFARRAVIRHPVGVRGGFDGRAVAVAVLALILAVVVGGVAGSQAGAEAGALGAVAGLVPPAVLAVALEWRARNVDRVERRKAILGRYAPPEPSDGGDGEQ